MIRGLTLVCVLALILLPLTLGAQSNPTYQQDRSNVTQSEQTDRNVNPSADPSSMQNQERTESGIAQDGVDESAELPATAGELPLLGLIGALALAAAAGTRLLVRVRG
jgi:hypothetical protein